MEHRRALGLLLYCTQKREGQRLALDKGKARLKDAERTRAASSGLDIIAPCWDAEIAGSAGVGVGVDIGAGVGAIVVTAVAAGAGGVGSAAIG